MSKKHTGAAKRFDPSPAPQLTKEQLHELQRRFSVLDAKIHEQNGRALSEAEVRQIVTETATKLHGSPGRRR